MHFNLFIEGTTKNNIQDNQLYKRFISIQLHLLSSKISSLKENIRQKDIVLSNLALEYVQMGKDSLLMVTNNVGDDEELYGTGVNSIEAKSAMANYEKAIKISPTCFEAYERIGDLYFRYHQYEEAIKHYKLVSRNVPHNGTIYYKIGQCYQILENEEVALKNYTKALKYDKNNPVIFDSLASLFDSVGDEERAEIMRKRARILRGKKK